ncbi:hypothetical protein [Lysobacter sp. P5_B9]
MTDAARADGMFTEARAVWMETRQAEPQRVVTMPALIRREQPVR